MKKIIVILSFLPLIGYAQDGKVLKAVALPRVDLPKPDDKAKPAPANPQYSISQPFEPERFKFPTKVYEEPKIEPRGMSNQPKSDLNVGKLYAEKMNKSNVVVKEGNDNSKDFRRHMYFGEFKTESATISLNYRDFGEIDADRIRVWVDGKLVVTMVELRANSNKLYIGLLEGINHIEIEALNEGALSPNTGEFGFFDEQGMLITEDKWGLSTGFKAKFNINRVPKGTLLKSKTQEVAKEGSGETVPTNEVKKETKKEEEKK
ncbi:hypothetical protein [Flavobacterium sp. GCM10023249]|uniref:hypothetical protein n=1 Tax=unclassified Flavobacterium TaxID=196869 RepID=UPI003622748E